MILAVLYLLVGLVWGFIAYFGLRGNWGTYSLRRVVLGHVLLWPIAIIFTVIVHILVFFGFLR